MLTQKIVRDLLDYDPETGVLTWKKRDVKYFKSDRDFKIWNTRYSGKKAFMAKNKEGYFHGKIFMKTCLAHRIIFLHYYGFFPKETDHINRVRHDNRISNLREVTSQQNSRNQSMSKKNSSGVTGVHWCNTDKKWVAKIGIDGRMKHLGAFIEKRFAIGFRKCAEIRYGFNPNYENCISISTKHVLTSMGKNSNGYKKYRTSMV